MTKTENGATQM